MASRNFTTKPLMPTTIHWDYTILVALLLGIIFYLKQNCCSLTIYIPILSLSSFLYYIYSSSGSRTPLTTLKGSYHMRTYAVTSLTIYIHVLSLSSFIIYIIKTFITSPHPQYILFWHIIHIAFHYFLYHSRDDILSTLFRNYVMFQTPWSILLVYIYKTNQAHFYELG